MKNNNELALQLGHLLQEKQWLLTTAESCTGGGIAYTMTNIAGSSAWFDRGFITYSNDSKTELLNVPAVLISHKGAVSEEVAEAMAKGALAHSQAHWAIAVTGIAGPDGGTKDKPIGTVFFCWASSQIYHTKRYVFHGNRQEVREQTITYALFELIKLIK